MLSAWDWTGPKEQHHTKPFSHSESDKATGMDWIYGSLLLSVILVSCLKPMWNQSHRGTAPLQYHSSSDNTVSGLSTLWSPFQSISQSIQIEMERRMFIVQLENNSICLHVFSGCDRKCERQFSVVPKLSGFASSGKRNHLFCFIGLIFHILLTLWRWWCT